MGDTVGYFKGYKLGDLLHGPPEFSLQGSSAIFRGAVFGNAASGTDVGPRTYIDVRLAGALIATSAESSTVFFQRRLTFLSQMRSAVQYGSSDYSPAGILGVVMDSDNIRDINGTASAGATTVSLTAAYTFTSGQKLLCVDPTAGYSDLVTVSTTGSTTSPTISALPRALGNKTVFMVPDLYVQNAYLQPSGIVIRGNEVGTLAAVEEIGFNFMCADTPSVQTP